MAITNMTNFDAALKQIYSGDNLANTTLKRRPALAMLPKRNDFGGRNMPIVNIYGNPQGRSASFSNALSNVSGVSVDDFLLTRVSNYSIASVGGEVAEASRGDAMAFLQAMKASIDGAMNSLSNSVEAQLFRSGTGSIGTVGAYVGGASTFTLGEEEDVANFEVNMVLVASATDGSALRSGSVTVTGVNRSTGVITGAVAWDGGSGITSFAPGDVVYPQGDAANGGTNVCLSGFSAWLPTSTPAGTFFGVTRSTDSRLYGQYYDGSAGTVAQALITAQSLSNRVGGAPDVAFCNHVQYRALLIDLYGNQNFNQVNATTHKGVVADISFRSVQIQGDSGPIDVIAAARCPAESAFVLEMDTWSLATLGDPVKILNLDGQRILRSSSADSYECRIGFRGNLGCKAPIYNVNVAMPAV